MKLFNAAGFEEKKYSIGLELILPLVMDLLANLLKSCLPAEQPSESAQRFLVGYNRTARAAVAKAYIEAAAKNGVKVRQTEAAIFASEYLAKAATIPPAELATFTDIAPQDEFNIDSMI